MIQDALSGRNCISSNISLPRQGWMVLKDDVFPTQSAAGPGNQLEESSGATGPDIFMTWCKRD